MQIFELHFNPKLREEQVFDSFIYEPENVYEKDLGSLYLVGELQNTLPQNLKLLDNLAKIIKANHYTLSLKSPEKALSQSLKKANEYLAEEVKKENVSWLGNLNFAALSIKDSDLFFTKTGNLKILLIRSGQIIDIGKNLEIQEIEPYPLKIFLSVVSGKLIQNDIILILTKDVFDFFYQQNLLTKIAKAEDINGKKLKEILPSFLFTKDEGSKISGICLLSIVKPRLRPSGFGLRLDEVGLRPDKVGGQDRTIYFQKEKKFSLPKLPKLPRLPKISLPKFPRIKIEKFQHITKTKKKLIPILVLISILVFGFLIFKGVEQVKESSFEASLAEIEKKVNQAENFLIFKNEKQANLLLKEAWQEISVLTEKETPLKQKIKEKLEEINKLEKIEEPEIVEQGFSFPVSSENLTYLGNIYFLDKESCEIIKSGKKWMEDKGPCSLPKSMAIDGSIWILNGDNSIVRYYAASYQETIILDIFPFIENITKIETRSNLPYLYLLEPVNKRVIITDKTGKIVKQFQSQKFDNLTDFAISADGKTIYLLNDSKVYQVEM